MPAGREVGAPRDDARAAESPARASGNARGISAGWRWPRRPRPTGAPRARHAADLLASRGARTAVAWIWLLAATLCRVSAANADARGAERDLAIARGDEPSLIAFLRAMPKGADLHNHAGGASYAEYALDNAVRQLVRSGELTVQLQLRAGPSPGAGADAQ
jgi:hypothetical protein